MEASTSAMRGSSGPSSSGRTPSLSGNSILLLVLKEGLQGAARALALSVEAIGKLLAWALKNRHVLLDPLMSLPGILGAAIKLLLASGPGRVLVAVVASLVCVSLKCHRTPGADVQLSSSLSLLFGMIRLKGNMAVRLGAPSSNDDAEHRVAPVDELRINCSQGLKDTICRFLEAQAARDPSAVPTWQLSPQKQHQPSDAHGLAFNYAAPASATASHDRLCAAAPANLAPFSFSPLAAAPATSVSTAAAAVPPSAAAPAVAVPSSPLADMDVLLPPPPLAALLSVRATDLDGDGDYTAADGEPDPSTPPATKPAMGTLATSAAAAGTTNSSSDADISDITAVADLPAVRGIALEHMAASGTEVAAAGASGTIAAKAGGVPHPHPHHTPYTHGNHAHGSHPPASTATSAMPTSAAHNSHAAHGDQAMHSAAFLATLGPSLEEPAMDHSSFLSLMAAAGTYKPSMAMESAAAAAALLARTAPRGSDSSTKQGGGRPKQGGRTSRGGASGSAAAGAAGAAAMKKSPESILGLRNMGIEGWHQGAREWERVHTEAVE